MKWIEVNIECSSGSENKHLMSFVKPVVTEFRNDVKSWHFLWEGKHYPLTLRLRFYGNEEVINNIRTFLDEHLKGVTHAYGSHGNCAQYAEYTGEINDWGSKGWTKGVELLEFGSEFALELVENKDKLGTSEEYRKNAFDFADRYTHLFLNQISSLLNEADFYLDQGIFRHLLTRGIQLPLQQIQEIREKIKHNIVISP